MKRAVCGLLSAALCITSMSALRADTSISIEVYPAFAPNGQLSPNWDTYVGNALGAIELGVSNVGDRSVSPAAYEQVSGPVTPLDMIYTNYNSWHATASPAPAFAGFGPNFSNEFGNRIHFGLHIDTDGSRSFALQDLSWALDSNDNTDYFDQDGDFSTANYSPTRIGIDYVDGIKGNGNDVIYDGGQSGALAVNELIYVGVGDGFFSQEPGSLNDQADINATLTDLVDCAPCSFDLAGIYTLKNPLGGTPLIGAADVQIVIDPAYGGDLDHDGVITSADKDMLTAAIAAGQTNPLLDIDGDGGTLDFDDLEMMVRDVANTWFGDANCDGEFNSGDLVDVFVAGVYETGAPAVWSTGDFNGDGVFDTGDLVIALADGGYNQGPRSATAAVPEPASMLLAAVGFALLAARRRS